jgi:hypothetical protein
MAELMMASGKVFMTFPPGIFCIWFFDRKGTKFVPKHLSGPMV